MESKMDRFMEMIDKRMNMQEDATHKLEARLEQMYINSQLMFENHSSSIHNLDVQIG